MARRGRPPHPDVLTPAEWRVLEELRAGGTYLAAAVRLGVQVGTVKFHARNMRHKLRLETREQLVAWRHEREAGDRRGVLAPLALFSSYWQPALSTAVVVAVGGAAIAAGVLAYAVVNTGEPSEEPTVPATRDERKETAASPSSATPVPTVSPSPSTPVPPTSAVAPSPTPSASGTSPGRRGDGDTTVEGPAPEVSVTTLAGGGTPGYQDGEAAEASFGSFMPVAPPLWPPQGIAFERDGSLLVADMDNAAIRRISPTGRVSTVAGGNGPGLLDGPADTAQFSAPVDVAIAEDGTIYVVERGSDRLREVTPEGMVRTVVGLAGLGSSPGSAINGPVEEATLYLPVAVALDGNVIYVADRHGVRRITEGMVSTHIPRTGRHVDGFLPAATVGNVVAMDVSREGVLYLLDYTSVVDQGAVYAIRVVMDRQVRTLYVGDPAAYGGTLSSPSGIAVGPGGSVYVSSTAHHQILALGPDGELRVVAGTGEAGDFDGSVNGATLNHPAALALHRDGTMAVVDAGNGVIRLIDSPAGSPELSVVRGVKPPYLEGVGEVTVFAGRGTADAIVDGPAREASFGWPKGMALDTDGSVLVAALDTVRSIAPDGYVTTLAGDGEGYLDGPCDEALFTAPENLALHPDGDIYVAEMNGHRIRRINRTPDGCQVTTVIGSGDDSGGSQAVQEGPIPVEQARVKFPRDIAVDRDGNILILHSDRIRLLTTEGVVYTYTTQLTHRIQSTTVGFDIDAEGNIFLVQPHAIVMLDRDGVISPVFEDELVFGWTLLSQPYDVVVGSDGALYATDFFYGVVLRFTRDGEASIVAGSRQPRWNKEERPLPEGAPDEVKFAWTSHLLFDANGDLLLSDPMAGVIWRIPLP